MHPLLDLEHCERIVEGLRDRAAREEQCLRILGFLVWPNGRLRPGTDEEKRVAREELQRLGA